MRSLDLDLFLGVRWDDLAVCSSAVMDSLVVVGGQRVNQ
jgi:hypothetical protein